MNNQRIIMIYLILLHFLCNLYGGGTYNLDLVYHIDEIVIHNNSSNFGVSDVWGYTDEVGNEYAIVGYRFGTFIYKISLGGYALVLDVPGPSNGDYYYHRDYKIYGDHLYIVNEMSGNDQGMQIIDLSPLPYDQPVKRNTYTGITQSHNLWIDSLKGLAFIENNYPDNIHIVDLLDPDNPIYINSFNYTDADNCHDIYSTNNLAFISEGYSSQFSIYDISDIVNPISMATIPTFGYAHNAWTNNLGTHLITGEETVGMTVKIWDIQDYNNINLVGEYLGENLLAHNVHVKGSHIYISHYTTGLKIVDIYNPEDPIEVAAYDTYPDDDNSGFFGCWGVYPFTSNNYVYASDMQYGLFIFEFNNVNAGWVYGTISNSEQLLSEVKIISRLNGKIFYGDMDGQYDFGFSEGEHLFDFYIDDEFLGTKLVNIFPHQYVENNFIFYTVGDFNGDGDINILDVVLIVNLILYGNYDIDCDLNQDSFINILDIIQLVNIILG